MLLLSGELNQCKASSGKDAAVPGPVRAFSIRYGKSAEYSTMKFEGYGLTVMYRVGGMIWFWLGVLLYLC